MKVTFLVLAHFEKSMKAQAIFFVLNQYPASLGCTRETDFKFAQRERFREEIKRAGPHCCNGAPGVGVAGQQDCDDRGIDG